MQRELQTVDPDQTAPLGADLGLHCLPRPVCPKTLDHYGKQRTTKALIRLRRLYLCCSHMAYDKCRSQHIVSVDYSSLFHRSIYL